MGQGGSGPPTPVSADESRAPETTGGRRARSWVTHPLLLALIPAVTAIVVAVITLDAGGGDSIAPSPSTAAGGGGLEVRIDRDLDAYHEGWNVAFDEPLPPGGDAATSDGRETLLDWATTRGAVDVGRSSFRLYLDNDGDERLTVREMRARVERRDEPISATLLVAPAAGANDLVELFFPIAATDVVDAETVSEDAYPRPTGQRYFDEHNISLDPGETIDLKLIVTADGCTCHYVLELEILVGGSRQVVEVRDEVGELFAITARADRYEDQWEDGTLGCNRSELVPVTSSGIDCQGGPSTP